MTMDTSVTRRLPRQAPPQRCDVATPGVDGRHRSRQRGRPPRHGSLRVTCGCRSDRAATSDEDAALLEVGELGDRIA